MQYMSTLRIYTRISWKKMSVLVFVTTYCLNGSCATETPPLSRSVLLGNAYNIHETLNSNIVGPAHVAHMLKQRIWAYGRCAFALDAAGKPAQKLDGTGNIGKLDLSKTTISELLTIEEFCKVKCFKYSVNPQKNTVYHILLLTILMFSRQKDFYMRSLKLSREEFNQINEKFKELVKLDVVRLRYKFVSGGVMCLAEAAKCIAEVSDKGLSIVFKPDTRTDSETSLKTILWLSHETEKALKRSAALLKATNACISIVDRDFIKKKDKYTDDELRVFVNRGLPTNLSLANLKECLDYAMKLYRQTQKPSETCKKVSVPLRFYNRDNLKDVVNEYRLYWDIDTAKRYSTTEFTLMPILDKLRTILVTVPVSILSSFQ